MVMKMGEYQISENVCIALKTIATTQQVVSQVVGRREL
jgi:hypothetical protein